MKLAEVDGIIHGVCFETDRGFYLNTELSPYHNGYRFICPIDDKVLKRLNPLEKLYRRKIKVTVELIEENK